MNEFNEVDYFRKLLKLRTIFKQINQISWNITALEKRYPLGAITDTEIKGLLNSYIEYTNDVKKLNDELRNELKGGRDERKIHTDTK